MPLKKHFITSRPSIICFSGNHELYSAQGGWSPRLRTPSSATLARERTCIGAFPTPPNQPCGRAAAEDDPTSCIVGFFVKPQSYLEFLMLCRKFVAVSLNKLHIPMKKLLCLAAMGLFLFVGSILSVQSQATGDINRMIYCSNGECATSVWESGGGWTMTVACEGNDDPHVYHGTGSYGGSVCGITME